ncbi:anti-repressor SinI family protein [Cytobacillus gottheilii]|nr:anti-repressor SinI family protein [Cytobacillus gottheilii]
MEKLMKPTHSEMSKEQFDEWYVLLLEAKRMGLTIEDIRKFFRAATPSPR